MKTFKFQFLFLGLAAMLAFTTSCKKDEDTTPDPDPVPEVVNQGGSFFSFDMEGTTYKTEGFYAYAVDFDETINIYGVLDATGEDAVYIELPAGFSEGVHDFNQEVFAYVVIGEKVYSTRLGNGSGSVTIDEFDGVNIKGSFSFEAVNFDDEADVTKVTNGSFNVDINE